MPREEFQEANAEFARNLYQIEEQLRIVALSRSTSDSFLRFAELQFMDIGNAWRIAGPAQRQRVQNLLFEGGLDYSPGVGILNRSNCSLFCSIEAMSAQKSSVVEAAGVEPTVSIDYRQLTDSRLATKSSNATIAKSAVQTLYKNLNELHE